jgi:hypothetical protein
MRSPVPFALAGAFLALASGAAAAAPETISFVSVQVSTHGSGHTAVSVDNDYRGKTKIGHDTLTCNIVNARLARCLLAVTLAKGTIRGRLDLRRSSDEGPITITGGTGRYKDAKGTGKYRILNESGTRTSMALHLK